MISENVDMLRDIKALMQAKDLQNANKLQCTTKNRLHIFGQQLNQLKAKPQCYMSVSSLLIIIDFLT